MARTHTVPAGADGGAQRRATLRANIALEKQRACGARLRALFRGGNRVEGNGVSRSDIMTVAVGFNPRLEV